jgi:hypothetical protein
MSPELNPDNFWPQSVTGWISVAVVFVATLRWAVIKIRSWGKSTDKWDGAADALKDLSMSLKKLSDDVRELVHEIRGVGGQGGMRGELEAVKKDVKDMRTEIGEIKERNEKADVLVDIYKMDLIERRKSGAPMRREMDVLVQKIAPETT